MVTLNSKKGGTSMVETDHMMAVRSRINELAAKAKSPEG